MSSTKNPRDDKMNTMNAMRKIAGGTLFSHLAIVYKKRPRASRMSNRWKSPKVAFGCCAGGFNTCAYVTCCAPCARGEIAQNTNETICAHNCMAAGLMYTILYPIAPFMRCYDRRAIARERRLESSMCGACASTMLCAPCTDVQEYIEVVESDASRVGARPHRPTVKAPRQQLIVLR